MLYVTALLDVQPVVSGQQYYFSQPNAFMTSMGQTSGPYSPAGRVLFSDTVPLAGTSASNYVDLLSTSGNYLSWTYKINTAAVCDPNTGSVTGSGGACTGGTKDLSAVLNTFLRVDFIVGRYNLAQARPLSTGNLESLERALDFKG